MTARKIQIVELLHAGVDPFAFWEARQEEVDYFLENQLWPWSQEVQELYKESVMNNQYVQINPMDAVTQARQIYNQQIILEIISWQKKEGQFLLNGVIVNYWGNRHLFFVIGR